MVRPAVQLPPAPDLDHPLADLIERAAAAGFEGVEFTADVEDADVHAVRSAMAETDLSAVGAHVSIHQLGEDTEATLGFYRGLGCERFVVPGIPPERFESRRAVETATQRLDGLAVALRGYGVSVHYNDRGYEFVDLGDRTTYEYLVELTEHVGFDLDTANALAAGVDPVGLLDCLDGRAPLFHPTDYDHDAGERVPLGRGDLDVPAVVEAHAAAGGEWIVHT
ncbi:MAG: sugar phosphate isomerase/epimerase family protein [Halobacteriales archaeon]